jgi:cobalt-zinc-cadmium efflux system outer membrane protein
MTTLKQAVRSCGKAKHMLSGMLIVLLWTHTAGAQTDTLRLNLKQAERIFLEKNLALLAQHYNIEASKALVQQARLWDDPTLSTDQNIYANNKWFEHGNNPDGSPRGQYFIQLQQLIKTGGKRGRLMDMAHTNTQISEWQFTQLMQNLKFQLRSDFYTAAQLTDLQELYLEQGRQLDRLLKGMQAQFNSGNVARKDLLRVQALQVSLQQQATDNLKQMEDIQSELRTLLALTEGTFIRPLASANNPASIAAFNTGALIDSARTNNAGYQLERLQLQYQRQNLSYQKALAVPDVTIGPSYDLNSNYAPRYAGLGISLPLPVLNGNRGNIKAARWQTKQEETSLSQADIRLQNDVAGAYKKYLYSLQLHTAMQQGFYTDYKKLQDNITESFRQKQISLLEFIDYFNDYETVCSKQLQQQLDLQLAQEELNLQVGIDLFD